MNKIKKVIISILIIFIFHAPLYSAVWKNLGYFKSVYMPDYNAFIWDLEIVDDSTFLAICSLDVLGGYCDIRRTTNSGETWQVVFIDSTGNTGRRPGFNYLLNNDCLVTSNEGILIHSSDKGKTWKKTQLDKDSSYYFSFKNNKCGIRYATKNNVYNQYDFDYTIDGGITWRDLYLPDDYKVNTVFLNMYNINFLIGYNYNPNDEESIPTFIRVEDSLRKWTKYEAPKNMLNFSLPDSINCWGTGENKDVSSIRQYIYYSNDGCKTWQTIRDTNYNSTQLNDIKFTDSKNGIIAGEPYELIRTTDGGNTWINDEYEGLPSDLKGTIFIDFKILSFKKFGDKLIALGYMKLNATHSMFLLDISNTTYIEERSNKIVNLFPNPASTQITLSLGKEFVSEPEIDIIDYLGKMQKVEYQINSSEITINTSSLSPGVYFLRIRSGAKVETRKFVVI